MLLYKRKKVTGITNFIEKDRKCAEENSTLVEQTNKEIRMKCVEELYLESTKKQNLIFQKKINSMIDINIPVIFSGNNYLNKSLIGLKFVS